jgi:hypothetical protein
VAALALAAALALPTFFLFLGLAGVFGRASSVVLVVAGPFSDLAFLTVDSGITRS